MAEGRAPRCHDEIRGAVCATLHHVPELPEVETIRRQLDPLLRGPRIVDAWAFGSAKFSDAPFAVGSVLAGVRRRGKYLLIDLVDDTGATPRPLELIVHLGMTGRLSVDGPATIVPAPAGDLAAGSASTGAASSWSAGATAHLPTHLRASWQLDDGRAVLFDDVRRFGRIAVVAQGDHAALPTLAALGPEPFDDDFTPERLREQVNGSSRHVKTQLLSQRVVAGVGNIYADEALWRAQVHPGARRLTRRQAVALRDEIRHVLAAGIGNGGTTLRNYRDAEGGSGRNQRFLDCYGRAGEPCVRCGEPLRRTVLDARTTTYCATCQKR